MGVSINGGGVTSHSGYPLMYPLGFQVEIYIKLMVVSIHGGFHINFVCLIMVNMAVVSA